MIFLLVVVGMCFAPGRRGFWCLRLWPKTSFNVTKYHFLSFLRNQNSPPFCLLTGKAQSPCCGPFLKRFYLETSNSRNHKLFENKMLKMDVFSADSYVSCCMLPLIILTYCAPAPPPPPLTHLEVFCPNFLVMKNISLIIFNFFCSPGVL